MEAEFTALLKASQKVSGLYLSYEVNITLWLGFSSFSYTLLHFSSLLATIYYLNLFVFTAAHRGCMIWAMNLNPFLFGDRWVRPNMNSILPVIQIIVRNKTHMWFWYFQAEQRFLWNNYLMEPLIENKVHNFLLIFFRFM